MKKSNFTAVLILLLVFWCPYSLLGSDQLFELSTGQIRVADSYIDIDLNDFVLQSDIKAEVDFQFIQDSVDWIRGQDNLLMPYARLKVSIKNSGSDIFIKYNDQTIIPEQKDNAHYFELKLSLFNPKPITIIDGAKKLGTFNLINRPRHRNNARHLIDISCLRWGLVSYGLEDDYLTVGCQMKKSGKIGSETPNLEISFFATNFSLLDGTKPPFKAIATSNGPIEIVGVDNLGVKKIIKIQATKIPNRLYRLKTAWGIGPYQFQSSFKTEQTDKMIAPSAMLYARFDLSDKTSFRLFDAAVYNRSLFNNLGVYYAYELAELLDNQIQIVPLLGIQTLTFQFDSDHAFKNDLIFPQGGEILWRDPFGLKNYSAYFGVFKDLGMTEYDYINTWIRFGKSVFYEINYIKWEKGDVKSAMWGLSVGLPLANFF